MVQAQASGVGLINLPFDLKVFLAINDFNPASLQPVTAIVNGVLGATSSTVAQAGSKLNALAFQHLRCRPAGLHIPACA